jgi:HlyD family secretion protein
MKRALILLAVIVIIGMAVFALVKSGGLSAIAAARQSTQPTAAPTLPAVEMNNEIVAEGELVPVQFVDLSFNTSGLVSELSVKEGDRVEAGQTLAVLRNQEKLIAEIAAAETDLLNASQALEKLASSAAAERAAAMQLVATYTKQVKDAQYQMDNYTIASGQESMTAMEAVQVMGERLEHARAAFTPYKFLSSGNSTRRHSKTLLDTAQVNYNSAIKRLDYEYKLDVAKANLKSAMEDYNKLKDGPAADKVAAAEANIKNSEARLAAAQASLKDLQLVAPFSGTIVSLDLKTGQFIAAGSPILTLADLSALEVHTTDLTELNVVSIRPGDPAKVMFDALPDQELAGVVHHIENKGEDRQGDIVYTAVIRPNPEDAWSTWEGQLRWLMTASVTIQTGE